MGVAPSHSERVEQLLERLRFWADRSVSAEEFLREFRRRGYSSQVIADAMVRVWAGDAPKVSQSSSYIEGLSVLLQQTLTSEHVAAQQQMNRSASGLSIASVFLAIVAAVTGVMEYLRGSTLGTRETSMIDVTSSVVQWVYLACAVLGSSLLGLGAYKIHVPPESPQDKEMGARRWWQKWFNFTGAAVGWVAGWVVLVRWFGCEGFVCQGEPTGWTILLAAIAFAGIAGFMPQALAGSLNAISAAVGKLIHSKDG